MSRQEQRLQGDLNRIRERVAHVSTQVEEALANAIHALMTHNRPLAAETILGDGPINRQVRDIDRLCHGFIALHLPGAGPLRMISSVIRTAIELERIGDYAVTICRQSLQLRQPLNGVLANRVELMASESRRMFHQAAEAFNRGNAEMARTTKGIAAQVDVILGQVYDELALTQGDTSIKEMLSLFGIFTALERVSDQSKNICEEALFALEGETKPLKIYNILFIDSDDHLLARMAAALGTKSYPQAARFTAISRTPATTAATEMVAFLEQHGIEVVHGAGRGLDLTAMELAEYHVIVSLQGAVEHYFDQLPFHCVPLQWDLDPAIAGTPNAETLEGLYRELAHRLRGLMVTLRGEGGV